MNYINLYPTYEKAKSGMLEWREKQTDPACRIHVHGMVGEENGNWHHFIVVPVSINTERMMGLVGKCDATALLKEVENIKRWIEVRAYMMEREEAQRELLKIQFTNNYY